MQRFPMKSINHFRFSTAFFFHFPFFFFSLFFSFFFFLQIFIYFSKIRRFLLKKFKKMFNKKNFIKKSGKIAAEKLLAVNLGMFFTCLYLISFRRLHFVLRPHSANFVAKTIIALIHFPFCNPIAIFLSPFHPKLFVWTPRKNGSSEIFR